MLKHNEDKCFRVVLIAFGKIPGDWEHYRDESKMLAAIEPVTEGIMQLFCQTIILYIVSGPGEDLNNHRPVDFRHLLYGEDAWSQILYMCLLATSLTSVGTSLAKVYPNKVCQLDYVHLLEANLGYIYRVSQKKYSLSPFHSGELVS